MNDVKCDCEKNNLPSCRRQNQCMYVFNENVWIPVWIKSYNHVLKWYKMHLQFGFLFKNLNSFPFQVYDYNVKTIDWSVENRYLCKINRSAINTKYQDKNKNISPGTNSWFKTEWKFWKINESLFTSIWGMIGQRLNH